jgi:nucleoside-diphosphate-sugar epimerase
MGSWVLINARWYKPKISIDEGISRFIAWYRDYHGV